MYLNEFEVAYAVEQLADRDDLPNLRRAACTLARLVERTNENSDSWPSWLKPNHPALRLQALMERYFFSMPGPIEDVSDEDLKRALTPVKSFLTRHGIDHDLIIHQ